MTENTDLSWLLVRTVPQKEAWAVENVLRHGRGEPYLPKIQVTVRKLVRGVRRRFFVKRSLFPSYLFVLTDTWYWLRDVWGVASVVMQGEGPGVVPHREIAKLKSREQNGVVVLPTPKKLVPSQRVQLTGGVFSGYVGLVQGQSDDERVHVLLNSFGRVLVHESVVEAV